ncbi:17115_t:CDS:2 [Gigaspora margarita]|uniref:17115_t:CDS:1 n=1 Tax=Gigaspora margarita TaxID=4874 RepID=A0ABN7UMX7_GIGMA|nr:17115_t:CDS:2 [Gigaspora margarita]
MYRANENFEQSNRDHFYDEYELEKKCYIFYGLENKCYIFYGLKKK